MGRENLRSLFAVLRLRWRTRLTGRSSRTAASWTYHPPGSVSRLRGISTGTGRTPWCTSCLRPVYYFHCFRPCLWCVEQWC